MAKSSDISVQNMSFRKKSHMCFNRNHRRGFQTTKKRIIAIDQYRPTKSHECPGTHNDEFHRCSDNRLCRAKRGMWTAVGKLRFGPAARLRDGFDDLLQP